MVVSEAHLDRLHRLLLCVIIIIIVVVVVLLALTISSHGRGRLENRIGENVKRLRYDSERSTTASACFMEGEARLDHDCGYVCREVFMGRTQTDRRHNNMRVSVSV